MKVSSKVDCKCGFKTEIKFKKPGLFSPTVVGFACSGCESELVAFIHRPPGGGDNVKIAFKFSKISKQMAELLAEEKKEREDQNEQSGVKSGISKTHEFA